MGVTSIPSISHLGSKFVINNSIVLDKDISIPGDIGSNKYCSTPEPLSGWKNFSFGFVNNKFDLIRVKH